MGRLASLRFYSISCSVIKNQFLLLTCLTLPATLLAQQKSYPVHPDSKQQADVPVGELTHGKFAASKKFPGTERDYWIYVPKQVDTSKKTGVMVFQDGRNHAKRDGGFRAFKYDPVDDRFSRFLIEEMLPFIENQHGVKFRTDPNRNAICGSSSSGIAAFVTAWHRPDQFRRVFTTVDKVSKRKTKMTGSASWKGPVKPSNPRL